MPRPLSDDEVSGFRDRLIAAAETLFAEKGADGVTLRHLAAELGVSAMTPYRYFRDKDHIFSAVRAHGFTRFAEAMEEAYNRVEGPLERSTAVGEAYVRFALTHPAAYRLMFDFAQPDEGDAADLREAAARARRTLTRHAEGLVQAGLIEGDPNLIGHMFWASLHGALVLQMAGKLGVDIDPDRLRGETVRTLFRGLGLGVPTLT